jgi:hypothetical protein
VVCRRLRDLEVCNATQRPANGGDSTPLGSLTDLYLVIQREVVIFQFNERFRWVDRWAKSLQSRLLDNALRNFASRAL